MAEKKAKRPSFTTPKGTFKFPRLNEPDTKFNSAGEFSVKLVLSKDEAQPLIDKLKPLHDAANKAGKDAFKAMDAAAKKKAEKAGKKYTLNGFYTEEVDEDGEETGNIEFNFKRTASGTVKKTGKAWSVKSIPMFDAKGKVIKVNPWGGTVGKVSFSVSEYFIPGTLAAGIKLGLEGVQILELVEGGQKSAKSLGFGEEEGYDGIDDKPEGDESGDGEGDGEGAGGTGDASDF